MDVSVCGTAVAGTVSLGCVIGLGATVDGLMEDVSEGGIEPTGVFVADVELLACRLAKEIIFVASGALSR